MDVTQPLGNPQFYAITAQLDSGGGSVTYQIVIDGNDISQASADGRTTLRTVKPPRTR
jgi:hypothetical protein